MTNFSNESKVNFEPDIPGPKNVNVVYKENKRAYFDAGEATDTQISFGRRNGVDFTFVPVDAERSEPNCRWSPIAIHFVQTWRPRNEEKIPIVGSVGFEFEFKFDSSIERKSKHEMKLGPATLNMWNLRLVDSNGQKITDWPGMWVHTQKCGKSVIKSRLEWDAPKEELSWGALISQVKSVEMWPLHHNYWYGKC